MLGKVSIMDILYFIMKAATPHEEFEKNYPAAHQIQCAGPDRQKEKQNDDQTGRLSEDHSIKRLIKHQTRFSQMFY